MAGTKTSLRPPRIFPQLAFLDASYMRDLSRTITINTAIDALSHAVEGMLSVKASPVSDCLAKESMRLLSSCLGAMQHKTLEQSTRQTQLYASTLAGMVIAQTGTTAVHSLGYSLTYYKNVDHGRANGLLLPAFMEFVQEKQPQRVAEILHSMGMKARRGGETGVGGVVGERERRSGKEGKEEGGKGE